MSVNKTEEEVCDHRDQAIRAVNNYLSNLISAGEKGIEKADKICYWISDYVKYIKKEDSFMPQKLPKYKRGSVIKAQLGFRVGSEFGGLHYCVVVDKTNSPRNPVITVVPLTSVKRDEQRDNPGQGNVYLGDDIYRAVEIKTKEKTQDILDQLDRIEEGVAEEEDLNCSREKFMKELKELDGLKKEFERMKKGSIALVNQITTISKMRIYDPRCSMDPLYNIRLSNENLDRIDEEIRMDFTK